MADQREKSFFLVTGNKIVHGYVGAVNGRRITVEEACAIAAANEPPPAVPEPQEDKTAKLEAEVTYLRQFVDNLVKRAAEGA